MIPIENVLSIDLDHLGVWRMSIFIGISLLFFTILLTSKLSLKGITWAYLISYCIFVLEFPFQRYGTVDTAFVAQAGRVLIEAALIPLWMNGLSKTQDKILEKFFTLLMCVEIFLIWYFGQGLMLMASFDTALLACFVPFAPSWLVFASLVTIFTHHGATAIVILLAQVVAYAIKSPSWRFYGLGGLLPVSIFTWFRLHDLSMGSDSRIVGYKQFMEAWWNAGWPTIIFGAGPGSFPWLSLILSNFKEGSIVQLHSDWLQIMFELGVVGFALVLCLVLKAIKDSWDEPRILAAVFGSAAFGLTYHPLRFFPSMLLIAYIMKKALSKRS